MINDEADEVIKELFDSLNNRYQNNLESMKGSEFVFDYVQLLYYECHKINPNRGGSHLDSPDWIKSKKATINPINKEKNKCFQYARTVAYICKERFEKNVSKVKDIVRLVIIVIMGENIVVLCIAYVIENTACLKKCL